MNDKWVGLLWFERGNMARSKGVSVELAGCFATLQETRLKTAQDGRWRIVLTPNDPFGRMLSDTIEAISGSGRTEVFDNGGKVTVTSSTEPFGDRDAILIIMGRWESALEIETLRAWKNYCQGREI